MLQILVWVTAFIGTIQCLVPAKDYRPDVFVLTDISNEPDDAQSLIRLLLYTNEVNLKGIVATTSYWLNDTIHDEDIYPILDAYEKVQPNLLLHSPDYPTAEYLRSITKTGKPVYGLEAIEDAKKVSSGAQLLIDTLKSLKQDDDHLFVLVWGGANVLAEALNQMSLKMKKDELDQIISKLTVYAISDQDNSGPWIRHKFPKLRYIASIHGFNHYGESTWVGISGEVYNNFDHGGPNSTLVAKEWVKENLQIASPLGQCYPDVMFNMEGDTPSTLFVLPNGLNWPLNPEYGGWGGRYTLTDLSANFLHYGDVQDQVVGVDGKLITSNKATIWRWREAYQTDFKERMRWTVESFETAAHEPIVVFNDTESTVKPISIEAATNATLVLDLSKSFDLNGSPLSYKWFHYRELSATQGNLIEVPEIPIESLNDEGSIVSVSVPDYPQACLSIFRKPLPCKLYHIIAEVTNESGLKGYQRFILKPFKDPNGIYSDIEPTREQTLASHDEL